MDIGAFYDRDPRRRSSDEVVLGNDWLDGDRARWRLAWLRDTGELFAMLQPVHTMPTGSILTGSTGTSGTGPIHTPDLTVFVLATLHQESEVQGLMKGWEAKQGTSESFEWLIRRLDAAGHPPPWTRPDEPGETEEHGLRAWIKRDTSTCDTPARKVPFLLTRAPRTRRPRSRRNRRRLDRRAA